jgi:lysophospholipase L1-like esterase
MKKVVGIFMALMLVCPMMAQETSKPQDYHENVVITKKEKTLKTHWAGRRVALLGDSMTDKRTLGPDMLLWWEYLSQLLGFDATYNYGRSGRQWHQIHGQAQTLWSEHQDQVDAILIFAGTNDYNAGVPIGEFFAYEEVPVEVRGPKVEVRKHRIPLMNDSTFCGRINMTLSYLKTQYPDASIVIMTPIHRGYAKFNEKNVQPDEYYCNAQGLFLEDYVEVLKKAAAYWSVPVVDLYAHAGIVPNLDSNIKYIKRAANDRLHPSTEGQYRIAKVMQYVLPTIY